MIKQIYIHLLKEIRGPYELWEVKILASKYRDFHVYSENKGWVEYRKWDKNIPDSGNVSKPESMPTKFKSNKVQLMRYIKRKLFLDHH